MKMFNVTIRSFLEVFNFISRMIYCIENDNLNDNYNRRYIKSYTCIREDYIINKWFKENNLDINEHLSYIFYFNTERTKYNLFFLDTDVEKLYTDNVVIEEGIFTDSIKNVFIFLPMCFVDFDVKKKIQMLQYIFYDMFIASPLVSVEDREKALKICELFACLLYVAPDYYDDRIKDYIDRLMEIIKSDQYIRFDTTDSMNIASVDLILENFVYGG